MEQKPRMRKIAARAPNALITGKSSLSRKIATRAPNVIITGTPGSGKSSLSRKIAARSQLQHLDVSALIKREHLYEEWDDLLDSSVYDEAKLAQRLAPLFRRGGFIFDFHSCAAYPAKLCDLAIVLTVSTETLFDRLSKRKYSSAKISNNLECEIFRVCEQEATQLKPCALYCCPHNTSDDRKKILQTVLQTIL